MRENGESCVFHYIPLHSAPAGRKFGHFSGEDIYTTRESEKLARIPMFYGLSYEEKEKIVFDIKKYFRRGRKIYE